MTAAEHSAGASPQAAQVVISEKALVGRVDRYLLRTQQCRLRTCRAMSRDLHRLTRFYVTNRRNVVVRKLGDLDGLQEFARELGVI